jgi:hypothetical protein
VAKKVKLPNPKLQALASLSVFALTYVTFTFIIPVDPDVLAKYDISATSIKLLLLTVILPLIGIWYIAFYGYYRFKQYANTVRKSKDGQAFNTISTGLKILAFGLPINSLASSLLSYMVRENSDVAPTASIINTMIPLLIALGAFWYIQKGARDLIGLVKKIPGFSDATILSFLMLAAGYCFLTFTHLNDAPSPGTLTSAVFYLPDWLVMVAIVVPYMYVWYKGVVAAFCILYYSKNIGGIWYKQAFALLAAGITAVIISSILLQYLTALSLQLRNLSLGVLLLIIYILLMVIAVGYLLIAQGSKKLHLIEEV